MLAALPSPTLLKRGTNMGKLKELAIDGLKILTLGVLVGAGVRAAEWAIPAPEMRVIVCTIDDFDHVETCTSAAELLKKHAG
jgi:hypothetical protein